MAVDWSSLNSMCLSMLSKAFFRSTNQQWSADPSFLAMSLSSSSVRACSWHDREGLNPACSSVKCFVSSSVLLMFWAKYLSSTFRKMLASVIGR